MGGDSPGRIWPGALAVGIAASAIFAVYQASSAGLVGVDGYFHIKYSQLLRAEGLIREFRWLPFTIYSVDYADDHFLFHLLLVPFTFGDLILGAKAYAVLTAAAVFGVFYATLLRQGVQRPILWTVCLLVSSAPFLARLSMTRASGVSLLMLLVGTDLILRGKDKWVGPIAFLYVWMYGGFPLLAIPVIIAFLVSAFKDKQLRLPLLAAYAIGTAAGLVVNPYFPNNLGFLWTSYVHIEPILPLGAVRSGIEDHPFDTIGALRAAPLVWGLVFVTIVYYLIRSERLSSNALVVFLFSIVLLCLFLNARRFIEYWPPFALLFVAMGLGPHIDLARLKMTNTARGLAAGAACLIVLGMSGYDTSARLMSHFEQAVSPVAYAGAARYLKERTPTNAVVFSPNWGDFPLLYFHNTHNRYAAGLGVQYLQRHNERLYGQWVQISRGHDPEPAQSIVAHFGADHVFCLKKEGAFRRCLAADKRATRVYQDDYAEVYRLGI